MAIPSQADFLWREARLIVEADSRAFHDTASAFEYDRKREQRFLVGRLARQPLYVVPGRTRTPTPGRHDPALLGRLLPSLVTNSEPRC